MKVKLAYGKTGRQLDIPEGAVVLSAQSAPALSDEATAIQTALKNPIGSAPLKEIVKPGDSVVVVHTDITRATPNERILPILLSELESAGIQRKDISLLNALGTHRRQTPFEMRTLLGDFIVDNYQCLQHNAWEDNNLISFGKTRFDHPVRINRFYAKADIRILTGFIEPHFFAGFSGGPKGVLPSIAGFESVLSNHGVDMISHPKATFGITHGNPIWEEMLETALLTSPSFILNVAMNNSNEITGIFAGDLVKAHSTGCDFVGKHAMIPVEQPFDVVITTNSGYPLDQNLYQSVKGLSAAARIVRKGGAILLVTACEDGLPAHGGYAELLRKGGSPQGILDMLSQPGFHAHDQWQVQTQAQIQNKANVYVYSEGLTDEEIKQALFTPVQEIQSCLEKLLQQYGPHVCILPDGPQTIPTLRTETIS